MSELFVRVTCFTCTIKWFMPEDFYAARLRALDAFYCPVGRAQKYMNSKDVGLDGQPFWRYAVQAEAGKPLVLIPVSTLGRKAAT
jgi:hypothetical protein